MRVGDDFKVRLLREDEFEAVLEVSLAAFGEEWSEEDAKAWRSSVPFDRCLGVFDAGRLVATCGVLTLELTVPGGVAVPMGGVTWVATLPTHRRRGLFRRLLVAQFADMAARDEILSGLGASESVIYGRFGYGPATSVMGFSVETAHSEFATLAEPATAGRLALLRSDEAAAILPALYDSLRLRVPGTVTRSTGLWQAFFADPMAERDGGCRILHVIHHDGAGRPDGYVGYRVKEDWKGATSHNVVKVVELMAADAAVYASLWRYLLDTDLCETVSCARGRVDEPLRWLLADHRRFSVDELSDFLWLHLHDIPRALAARRYAAAGDLVVEVSEPFPTPGTRRYLLQVDSAAAPGATAAPGAVGPPAEQTCTLPAECAPTSAQPDLALEAGALASTYLGGVSFATLAAAGRVRELTPGAVARADAMFRTATAPFCCNEF